MRSESDIIEHGEPSLIFTRREHGGKDYCELMIVINGNTHVYRLSDHRQLQIGSELIQYQATRRKS